MTSSMAKDSKFGKMAINSRESGSQVKKMGKAPYSSKLYQYFDIIIIKEKIRISMQANGRTIN